MNILRVFDLSKHHFGETLVLSGQAQGMRVWLTTNPILTHLDSN